LKHLSLYVEASTANASYLFFKKLPNTTAFFTIQNPMSIFIVWNIFAPDNEIWMQASEIRAVEILVTDTIFFPPSPIKLSLKKSLLTKENQVIYAQYIFPYKIEEDKVVGNVF
jgi:hypothetical protein